MAFPTARIVSLALAGCLMHGLASAQSHVVLNTHELAPGQHIDQLPQVEQLGRSFRDMQRYENWKNGQTHASSAPANSQTDVLRDGKPDVHHGQPKGGGGIGICDCWHEPDGSYTLVNNDTEWNAGGFQNADDGSYGPITLPFQFYLYGQYWNTAYININGNVSFGTYYGTYTSTGFPVSGFTMVAPFWSDVMLTGTNCTDCNKVQYKVTSTAMYVNWTKVGYFANHDDKLNTFQLVLTDGSDPVIPNGANVSFCYKDMQWTEGDVDGTDGFGGAGASVGANQGNGIDYLQFGRFDHEGIDYDGPFGANDGVSWLDNQFFTFATDTTTGNVPPVISGQSVCSEITICTGQTVDLQVSFYSPEPDQITTANSTSDITGYTIVSNTSGQSAAISTSFTAGIADIGDHTIQFTGSDDGTPPLTSVLNIIVHVLPNPGGIPVVTGTAVACPDGGTVLTASGNYLGYTWSNGFDGSSVLVGPGVYTVTGGEGGCAFTSDPFVVTAVPNPSPVIVGATIGCGGDPSTLATGQSYSTYQWSNGSTDPTVTVGSGSYSVTVTDANGCVGTAADVTVFSPNNPTAFFISSVPPNIFPGTTVIYTDSSSANGGNIVSYNWTIDTIASGSGPSITYTFDTPGSYTITLTVTTADGCTNSYTYVQTVVPTEIIVPNVFSPNGDTHNDALTFKNVEFYANTSLKVFNRWGQVIFESNNYKNTWTAGGVAEGTYFFVLKMASGKEYTGHVTLLR